MIVAFPVSNNRLINVGASCLFPEKEGSLAMGAITRDVPQEELLAQFEGWEEQVQQLCQVGDYDFFFIPLN